MQQRTFTQFYNNWQVLTLAASHGVMQYLHYGCQPLSDLTLG